MLQRLPEPVTKSEEQTRRSAAIMGPIQMIRAETQNWLRSIDELLACADLSDPSARASEIDRLLQRSRSIAKRDKQDVRDQRERLEETIDTDPVAAQWVGDEVTHILNSWDRAVVDWDSLKEAHPRGEAVLPPLNEIKKNLEDVRWRSGFLTIPARTRQHLKSVRVGQGLDFDATFKDELPDKDQRTDVLRYLRQHPMAVDGVVDVGLARIYKASPKRLRRIGSIGLILLAIAACFGILAVLAFGVHEFELPGVTTSGERWNTLWRSYLFVIVGAAAHVLVGAVKQSRARANQDAFLALDDLFLWMHVREIQLVLATFALMGLMLGTIFFLDKGQQSQVGNAVMFFAGYSYDSLIDVVLERFDTLATAQMPTLTAKGS